MYSNPPYRATIYVFGILLGYALRVHRNVKLTTIQMLCGWTVSVLLFLSVFILTLPMGSIGYVYNEYHAATFAAFGPMAWCGIFAWIIFTTHIGYSSMISLLLVALKSSISEFSRLFSTDKVSELLSWRGFLVTTRLSYAIYLTQYPIFFFNIGRLRYPSDYNVVTSSVSVIESKPIWCKVILFRMFSGEPLRDRLHCFDVGSANGAF